MSAHIPVDICTLMSYAIPLRIYSVVILTVFRLGSGAALSPNASPCAFDEVRTKPLKRGSQQNRALTPPTPVFDLTPLPLHSLVLTQKFLGRKDYRTATFEEGRWHSTSSPRLRSFRPVDHYSLVKNYTTFIIRVIPLGIQKLMVLVRDAVLRALLVPEWNLAETYNRHDKLLPSDPVQREPS